MRCFVVATPIGNLADITLRALDTLREVDVILAEDTRKTRILLKKYDINTKIIAFHHHTKDRVYGEVYERLMAGEDIAIVTDAGTPGISDPGNLLLAFLWEKIDHGDPISIIPIPGPSSVAAIISVSGFATDTFTFRGFLPKKGRARVLSDMAEAKEPQVFLESPHRILKVFGELREYIVDRRVIVGRELTKQFETLYRGTIDEILDGDEARLDRGEIIVLIEGKKARK